MMRMTDMVKHLLIINIIFFIGSYAVPQAKELLTMYYFESDKFRFWQPISSMFMHGGIGHIFFNMFALVTFGSTLEQFWGSKKFLFFYISCGLGAALLHNLFTYYELHTILADISSMNISSADLHEMMNKNMSDGAYYKSELLIPQIQDLLEKYKFTNEQFETLFNAACVNQSGSLGASGAIYGLLVAFAFMFPNAELMLLFLPVPVKAKYFVPALLLIDLYLGLNGNPLFGGSTGIAHFAHLGGALFGFIMMWYWKKNQFHNNRWDR
ncbi:MAG: rhomboid family intramembrane serine protease [Flavobacterium sp.]|nr:rhomboid family intramembrane serine protease [Flavobacterium sp.]